MLCSRIEKVNIRVATTTLLGNLWNRIYPGSNSKDLCDVITFFSNYWSTQWKDLPLGNTLAHVCNNFTYWNNIKTVYNEPVKFAADFAIRMTCAGVTECGVERAFSRMKWLLGTKRYRLSKETIKDLLILKDAKF